MQILQESCKILASNPFSVRFSQDLFFFITILQDLYFSQPGSMPCLVKVLRILLILLSRSLFDEIVMF